MWWLMGFGLADLQREAEAYVDAHWQHRGRSGFWMSSFLSNGTDAPDELGARKEAVARCGLRGDDVLSAVVVAPDTDIGPWEVTIRSSPDAAVGACVARLLESVPWDREHPGSAMVRNARTTGAAVAAWNPPEEGRAKRRLPRHATSSRCTAAATGSSRRLIRSRTAGISGDVVRLGVPDVCTRFGRTKHGAHGGKHGDHGGFRAGTSAGAAGVAVSGADPASGQPLSKDTQAAGPER